MRSLDKASHAVDFHTLRDYCYVNVIDFLFLCTTPGYVASFVDLLIFACK